MTERVDMYRGVHKGIRRILSGLVERAGITDFSSADDVRALDAAMNDAFALCESHAQHEDRFIMPLAAKHAPELVAKLDAEHHAQDEVFASLRTRMGAVVQAGRADAREGHEIVVALSRIVGELNVHMADEEERVQPLLWRAYDDETLARAEGELVASIAPPVLMAFLVHMLPAMNAPERVGFIRNMATGAPPEAVLGVIDLAKGVLRPDDMNRLEAAVADVIPNAA